MLQLFQALSADLTLGNTEAQCVMGSEVWRLLYSLSSLKDNVSLLAGRERRWGSRGFQQCETGLEQDQVKLFIFGVSCDNTSSTTDPMTILVVIA